MNREVEFLFDYGSPFSYVANLQIEGFAKRNGTGVTYTPILLGAVLQATGNALPMTVPAHIHALLTLALPVPRERRTVLWSPRAKLLRDELPNKFLGRGD